MKKLAFVFMIGIAFSGNAQVMEIITAIGGELLPQVVDGIKDIKDSGNERRVRMDRDEFNTRISNLNNYIVGITSALESDAKNLEAITKLSSKASLLYDDLGAMESFSQGSLVSAVGNSNNELTQREFAFAFHRDLSQLESDIDGLMISVTSFEINDALKETLARLVTDIRSEYNEFESYMEESGIDRPTAASTMVQIRNYLNSIGNAGDNIDEIKENVQDLLATLDSRLSSYVRKTSEIKDNVDSEFSRILPESE